MLDIAVAYNRYRFLGNEFLTWLWFVIETNPEIILACDDDLVDLTIGNRMVFENRTHGGLETITIKGDAAGLEEGILSLKKGASVAEISLVYKSGVLEWQFSIKGENLNISGLKLPETPAPETDEDMEAVILDKIYQFEKPITLIDSLYNSFIQLRLSNQWRESGLSQMKKWISRENRL